MSKSKRAKRAEKKISAQTRKALADKGIDVGSQKPIVKNVKIDDLVAAPYQRAIDEAWVNKIMREWNDSFVGVISVSDRDDQLWVMDGWHRTTAAKRLGKKHMMAAIYKMDVREEAMYFSTQKARTKDVRPIERHEAALVANDKIALMLESIVKSAGFKISETGENAIVGVTTIRSILEGTILTEYLTDRNMKFNSDKLLRLTLDFIQEVWHGDACSRTAWFIRGTAQFMADCSLQDMDMKLVKDKLAKVSPEYIEQRTNGHKVTADERSYGACCFALVEQYNKGRRGRRMMVTYTQRKEKPINL